MIVFGLGLVVGIVIIDNCDYLMFIGLLVIGSCFVEYVGCWFIGFLVEFGGKNFMIVVWGVNFDKVVKVVICVCFLNVG